MISGIMKTWQHMWAGSKKSVRFNCPLTRAELKTKARKDKKFQKNEQKKMKADQKMENQKNAEKKRVVTELKAEDGDKPDSNPETTSSSAEKSEDCYQVNDFNCS